MNRIEVIGLSGKSGSGKDYLGKMVLRRAGYHQWAFAWPMKTTCVGRGYSYQQVFHQKPPEVRRALQVIGTEEGWHIHGKNYWCDIAGAWLRTMHENLGLSKFYFTDVRFEHEVDFIHRMGGKVVRLTPGDRILPLEGTEAGKHSSETALDKYEGWDLVFENNTRVGPYQFRIALEEAGILPRWDNELEAVGGSADRMDGRFDRFFKAAIPNPAAAHCYDVPSIPFEQVLEEIADRECRDG